MTFFTVGGLFQMFQMPQSVLNFPYFWGRRRSSGTLTNIYARQIPSNFSFLFICFFFLVGRTARLGVARQLEF